MEAIVLAAISRLFKTLFTPDEDEQLFEEFEDCELGDRGIDGGRFSFLDTTTSSPESDAVIIGVRTFLGDFLVVFPASVDQIERPRSPVLATAVTTPSSLTQASKTRSQPSWSALTQAILFNSEFNSNRFRQSSETTVNPFPC